VLGSDFYAGYNSHHGLHQRCWVHFLRDVHELKKLYPHDGIVFTWAKDVKAISEHAVTWARQELDPTLSARKPECVRVQQQHVFEQQLWKLCQPVVSPSLPRAPESSFDRPAPSPASRSSRPRSRPSSTSRPARNSRNANPTRERTWTGRSDVTHPRPDRPTARAS
jgi:Transposase IS66 family